MSLNETPSSERVHIAFFGCRNVGKSSLLNAVTGQDLAVVSAVKGTTTDVVSKAMELLPLGPVVIVDTPGFDDEGMLGELRVKKTWQMLNRTDIAVLVIDGTVGLTDYDKRLQALFEERNLPYLIAVNKCDLLDDKPVNQGKMIYVSATSKIGIDELKQTLAHLIPRENSQKIVSDILDEGDKVVLVCPIDEAAPKGRIILPQQQTIRDILDANAVALVTRETMLAETLRSLNALPKMVITDSQALAFVKKVTPEDVPLTTFSILMSRYKGYLKIAVQGIVAAKKLCEGDKILMAEGCTHHRQCNDIGTVKIPHMLQQYCQCNLNFETCSGRDFPDDLTAYAMVIHCGGCMLTNRDVQYRMRSAIRQGIPFTNYGIVLAQMTGTLERTLRCFPDIHNLIV